MLARVVLERDGHVAGGREAALGALRLGSGAAELGLVGGGRAAAQAGRGADVVAVDARGDAVLALQAHQRASVSGVLPISISTIRAPRLGLKPTLARSLRAAIVSIVLTGGLTSTLNASEAVSPY